MARWVLFAGRVVLTSMAVFWLFSCQGRSQEPSPPAEPASPTDPDLLAWVWEFPTVETLNAGDPGPHQFPDDPPARPFRLEDLSPEDQAYYRNHAGIYVRKNPRPGGELSRRLLQLRRTQYTWGPDFYLNPPYGVLDWGGSPPTFMAVTASGGFIPLASYAQHHPGFDFANPMPDWERASDPEHPMRLLKQVLAEKALRSANRPEGLPSPQEAQQAVGDLYREVLQSLRVEAYDKFLGLLSPHRGLSVVGIHHSWEEWKARIAALPQGSRLPLEERYRLFQEPGEPDYVPLALRYGILEGQYKIYPNLFVNAEVDEFTSRYGNGVLFEFQFAWKGTPNHDQRLSMTFVNDDGQWKLADLDFWINLQ